jgi:argininosuccinate lyase
MLETSSITTVAELDATVVLMQSLRAELDYRRTTIEKQLDNAFNNAQDLADEIEGLQFKLASYNTVRAGMAGGPEQTKVDELISSAQQELQSALADQNDGGIQGALKRHAELTTLNNRIVYIDEYKTVLDTLRNTLPAAA